MNVFFEKIFKSFPNRQNFKIFPQRACKHLQNTKKYVIINKLISITIKNGLMVKRLRRCPLTAESAVRFRMGLPKKETTPLVVLFLFFSTPLRGNDAATCLPSFVNLRKQILAVGSHRPHFCFPVSYIWETATSAWGYVLLRCAETTRQLVCRRSSICVSKFLPRDSVLRRSKVSERTCKRKRQLPHGAILLRCVKRRGNLLPSFVNLRKQILAVVLRFTKVKSFRKGM